MRVVYLLLVVVAAVASAPVEEEEPRFYKLEDAPKLFEKFIKDYDRHYKDEADRKIHYDAFVDTLKFINEVNAQQDSYTEGITNFADFTAEERKARFGHGCLTPPKE